MVALIERYWLLRNGYGSYEREKKRQEDKEKWHCACGTGCCTTVMVHFMNGYGSYEREKKRQEDKETWRHAALKNSMTQ